MQLTVDAAKSLATRLSPQSRKSLECSSKHTSDIFRKALADDYTYKAMVEEVIGIGVLPSYTNHSWRDVYDFFTKHQLADGLLSSNVVVVKIALLAGVDPSINNNKALVNAAQNGNTEVLKLLLGDGRVDTRYNSNALYASFKSGNLESIRLLLNIVEITTLDEQIDMFDEAIYSNKLAVVKCVLAIKPIDLAGMGGIPIGTAIYQGNIDILTFFLDNEKFIVDYDEILIPMAEQEVTEEVFRLILNHPRTRFMCEENKGDILTWLLVHRYLNLFEEFLERVYFDSVPYYLLKNVMDTGNTDLLAKMLMKLYLLDNSEKLTRSEIVIEALYMVVKNKM